MTLAMLNFLVGIFTAAFVFALALTGIVWLIAARWDQGFRRRLDIIVAVFAGLFAWTEALAVQQSFDRVSDPRLQSMPVDGASYVALTIWAVLSVALLYLSLRRLDAAVRRLLAR